MPNSVTAFLNNREKSYISGQILDLANQRVFEKSFLLLCVHSAQSILESQKLRAGKMNLDRVFVNLEDVESLWFIMRFLVITVYTTKHLIVNIHLKIKRAKFDMHKKEEKQGHCYSFSSLDSARLKTDAKLICFMTGKNVIVTFKLQCEEKRSMFNSLEVLQIR